MVGLIEKLEIRVGGTRFQDDGNIRVDFRGLDAKGEINLSGFTPSVTKEEFFACSSETDLQELVRQKIIARLESQETENTEQDQEAK
ncbi:hypothetical protein P4637_08850 [Halalkalibacterium halodurans]|uniref:hypothetical protein n=1 Tax=Halalkalibacterium halodurans TaxID=86665 RepID=UPI002E1A75DB|nr:hypothetical protein [Halalkalibacterium halodurans]MED4084942.1 hypothetical protein [Halalkalibacterium halodurans]MED4104909.1 hypothetical protein [Halalkalibacterium halodurans]MED4110430.1 hypothetical protein [Halalkalibacterium halodurans]MED4123040.1 hypothetical protein [Halalkalibacterium halodurans]